MKTVLIWLLIVLLGVGVAYAMQQDPGYVLIVYKHTSFEMTLWFGLIALFVLLFLLRVVWGVLGGIITLPAYLKRRQVKAHAVKAQTSIEKAVVQMVEGDYAASANTFKKSAKYQLKPLVNYLGGALGLQLSGQQQQANDLLLKAMHKLTDDALPLQFMQIRLLIVAQKFSEALALLTAMTHQKSELWVLLTMQCYLGLGEWSQANDLYHAFNKLHMVCDKEKANVEQTIVIGNLGTLALDKLVSYWSGLSKTQKHHEAYVWLIADRLIDEAQGVGAIAILIDYLKQQSSEDMWLLLANCVAQDAQTVLAFALKQLKQNNGWAVNYCAGVAARASGDLNAAKSYLQASVAQEPSEQALLLLASIEEQQGLTTEAMASFKQLLALHQLN